MEQMKIKLVIKAYRMNQLIANQLLFQAGLIKEDLASDKISNNNLQIRLNWIRKKNFLQRSLLSQN